jgi:N-acetylglucosaminyl-diphospho-decaprenol L-rhamnosyltransferase
MSVAAAPVSLVVSVVTWRAASLTLQCLRALEAQVLADPGARVIVVDNDSQDGTAEAIEQALHANGWSGWVKLIRSPVNGGFAAGNNIAWRDARREHGAIDALLLLNPDTVPRPGMLEAMRRFVAAHPAAGIVGGRCEDPDGTPQQCCFRFPGIVSEFADQLRLGLFDRLFRSRLVRMGNFEEPVEVEWVSGAVMLIRREVIEAIGLMDESYFLYFEETDFTLRARRAGWKTWHLPQARAVHFVGQLTGVRTSNARPRRLPPYWYESRRRYFVLSHGLVCAIAIDVAVLCGNALWSVRRLLERKPAVDPPYWIRDLVSKGVLARGGRGLPPRRIG